jgi:hypothetical protein
MLSARSGFNRFASRSSAASQVRRRPRRDAAGGGQIFIKRVPRGHFTLPGDDLCLKSPKVLAKLRDLRTDFGRRRSQDGASAILCGGEFWGAYSGACQKKEQTP